MDELSAEDRKRAAAILKRREELRAYLAQVRKGQKFQIVIPDEHANVNSQSEPLMMLKMMALPEETRALAEAEIDQRIAGLEAKLKSLGVTPD